MFEGQNVLLLTQPEIAQHLYMLTVYRKDSQVTNIMDTAENVTVSSVPFKYIS